MMGRWTCDGACCIECATNIAVSFDLCERDLPESYHLIDGFSGRSCGVRIEQLYGGVRSGIMGTGRFSGAHVVDHAGLLLLLLERGMISFPGGLQVRK